MGHYPLIMVGAGPANLAVLIYLKEGLGFSVEDHCVVLESEQQIRWHPGLCTSQATLQISMLKDLVCLRDPTSHFTFINFLNERGVLSQYVHLDTFHPSRELYGQYLSWVAEHFASIIRYGRKVTRISQLCDGDDLTFCVRTEPHRGIEETYNCQRLLLAVGRKPYVPPEADIDHFRVFHSGELLPRTESAHFPPDGTYVVLGAGQSAGEVARYLLGRSRRARVHVISKGYLFRQIDDNPFVNDLYSDTSARQFFGLAEKVHRRRLSELMNTNYGVVDSTAIRDLYRLAFDRKVSGQGGLTLHSYSKLDRVEPLDTLLRVVIADLDGDSNESVEDVSAVVCATGYQNSRLRDLVGDLLPKADGCAKATELDEFFEVKLERGRGLFALNHGHSTHGLTEGTMTGLAHRAQRIGDRLELAVMASAQVAVGQRESIFREAQSGRRI